MNVFLPYTETDKIALAFKEDKKRFRAQLNEAKGILQTLKGKAEIKHPIIVTMKGNEEFLEHYIESFEAIVQGKVIVPKFVMPKTLMFPPLLALHRKSLYKKNPEVFAQFAPYDCLPDNHTIYRRTFSSADKDFIKYPWKVANDGKWLKTEIAQKVIESIFKTLEYQHLNPLED